MIDHFYDCQFGLRMSHLVTARARRVVFACAHGRAKGEHRQRRPTITVELTTVILLLSLIVRCVLCKYIDISTQQARRRESVNKMNALSSQNILI